MVGSQIPLFQTYNEAITYDFFGMSKPAHLKNPLPVECPLGGISIAALMSRQYFIV